MPSPAARRDPLVALAALAALALLTTPPADAQEPLPDYAAAFEGRAAGEAPELRYTVRVDSADPSAWHVALHVRTPPDTLRLAIPVWAPGAYRVVDFAGNLRGLEASSGGATLPVTADGPAAWRVVLPPRARGGREVTVRYRVAYPSRAAGESPNNRSFLRATGGLLDGPAAFLYLRGQTLLPAHVTLDLPRGWRVATGLVPTADPRTYWAPSYDVLIDSPVLVGALRVWPFTVAGVPHRVAYWPRTDAVPFDTAAFVAAARRVVEATHPIAGRLPYRDYTFLFVDGSGGGLEHLNSTTIGAPSEALARDPHSRVGVTAHEFFHLWNVKRLRPAALGPFDYARPVRVTELWWSEGVTDYFGNEITRRAGFDDEAAAVEALRASVESYLDNPARSRVSPERSSYTAWDTPAANGGYAISYYLQGALLGELLELELRGRTGLRRGMDDLLRDLLARYAGAGGFARADLPAAASRVCGCELRPFFARYVAAPTPLDFDASLARAGWRLVATTDTARDSTTRAPLPDRRVALVPFAGVGSAGGAAGGRPRLSVPSPLSAWGRAGLLTSDELVDMDGVPIADQAGLRRHLDARRLGDRVRVRYLRAGRPGTATVTLTPYTTTRVRIVDLPTVTAVQRALRRVWLRGAVGASDE